MITKSLVVAADLLPQRNLQAVQDSAAKTEGVRGLRGENHCYHIQQIVGARWSFRHRQFLAMAQTHCAGQGAVLSLTSQCQTVAA